LIACCHAWLAGDIAFAVATNRLLTDVLGSTRGGYAAQHPHAPLHEAEAEATMLEAVVRMPCGAGPRGSDGERISVLDAIFVFSRGAETAVV
jgi:hypothetical protein